MKDDFFTVLITTVVITVLATIGGALCITGEQNGKEFCAKHMSACIEQVKEFK